MLGITSDTPLKSTCAVCGEPLGGLAALPASPGKQSKHCGICGMDVCGKHYSQSRGACVRCTAGKDSWCKTPKIPPIV